MKPAAFIHLGTDTSAVLINPNLVNMISVNESDIAYKVDVDVNWRDFQTVVSRFKVAGTVPSVVAKILQQIKP